MIETPQLRRLETAYPAMRALSPEARERIRREAAWRSVPDRTVALSEGTPCTDLFLPVSGGIRVVKPLPEGREMVLYRVGPGELCVLSLSCLLGPPEFPGVAVVEGDLVAAGLPRTLFRDLVAASDPFRDLVFASFARRLADLMGLVEAVAVHRLDRRLADLLRTKGDPVRATHQELADELGSVREIVSRILKHFESDGIVRLGRGEIGIVDASRLGRIADGGR